MPAKTAERTSAAVYSRNDVRAQTGYSDTSLDRLEAAGVISPLRTPSGRRVYTDADIGALKAHREMSKRRRSVA